MVDDALKDQTKPSALVYLRENRYTTITGTVVLCCPVDLVYYSAMTRYVIREYGQDQISKQRPALGKAIHLVLKHHGTMTLFYRLPEIQVNILCCMMSYIYA